MTVPKSPNRAARGRHDWRVRRALRMDSRERLSYIMTFHNLWVGQRLMNDRPDKFSSHSRGTACRAQPNVPVPGHLAGGGPPSLQPARYNGARCAPYVLQGGSQAGAWEPVKPCRLREILVGQAFQPVPAKACGYILPALVKPPVQHPCRPLGPRPPLGKPKACCHRAFLLVLPAPNSVLVF